MPRGPYVRQDPSDLNVRAVAPEIFNALIALAKSDRSTIAAQVIRALQEYIARRNAEGSGAPETAPR